MPRRRTTVIFAGIDVTRPLEKPFEAPPTDRRTSCPNGYTLPTLVKEQEKTAEAALWRAVRTLRERATLLQRLAERTGTREFAAKADLALRAAATIEAMLPAELE